MRKVSAHYIFTGTGNILNKGVITLNEDGVVTNVLDTHGEPDEMAGVEFYNGVITPGFVNAHCHLELSHLYSSFPEKLGLPGFLKGVAAYRHQNDELVIKEARNADHDLWREGVVAVGDISNNSTTFPLKSKSKITYHTFIEAFGFSPLRCEKAFQIAMSCFQQAQSLGLQASVVPHSPYSVSKELFHKIAEFATVYLGPISIHNQESKAEDELYRTGEGEIVRHLQENLKLDLSSFRPSGKSALESIIAYLPKENNLLLVHNIYTGQSDIDLIDASRGLGQTWFVICPGSNLYIGDQLPDIELFRKNNLRICLGTDSLSSNHKLSLLEEMKIIQTHHPVIPLGEIITWATLNGAQALGMDHWAGTIETGKRPGINLITGMDLHHLRLKPGSRIKKLI